MTYEISYIRIVNNDINTRKIFIRPDNKKKAIETFEWFANDEYKFLKTVFAPDEILMDMDKKNNTCRFYKKNDFAPMNDIVGKMTMNWVMCEN